jgi:hypothetical protein
MKTSLKIAAASVAIICLLAFSSVPALAAKIPGQFTAKNDKPKIDTITGATSVECNPDGTATLSFTVRCSDANGYQDLSKLEAQLYMGNNKAGPLVTQTTKTSVSGLPKEADYVVSIVFQYYWLHGDYKVTFTVSDQASETHTKDSNKITYLAAAGLTVDGSPNLNFGTLDYAVTSDPPQTASIHNSANTPIRVSAEASEWVSSLPGQGSPIPINSLKGKSTGAYQPMPIATLATSDVGTLSGGTGDMGARPASITTSWTATPPAQSDTFVLAGTYSTTITLTATATG